jgi:hypothetical protein
MLTIDDGQTGIFILLFGLLVWLAAEVAGRFLSWLVNRLP